MNPIFQDEGAELVVLCVEQHDLQQVHVLAEPGKERKLRRLDIIIIPNTAVFGSTNLLTTTTTTARKRMTEKGFLRWPDGATAV